MKKFFFLFALLISISTFTLLAQPSLTSTINPQIGDIVTTAVYLDSVYPQGPAGANKTWDFSTLPADYNTLTYYVTDTPAIDSLSRFPADFPEANIASFTTDTNTVPGDSNFTYSAISANQLVNWGQASNEQKIIYTKGEILFNYPFNYSNVLIDTFAGTVTNIAGTFNRTGIETVTADAYGALTLPQGVFYDLLRVSRKEVINDSGTFGGDGSYLYVNQTYEWYSPIYRNSLLTISFDTTYYSLLDSVYVFTSYSATYGLNTTSGVKTISPFSLSLNVFPNPAGENISIKASAQINRITISNVLGQNVIDLQEEYNVPGNPIEISVADLPAGIYMCSVVTPSGVLSKKVVKE